MALIEFKDLPDTSTPITASNLNNNFNEILNLVFPIGKVEIFYDNADYNNYLGFTWERTLIGRVPVGIDTTQTEFNNIGKTGGEKTHTLTINEIPPHTHKIKTLDSAASGSTIGVVNQFGALAGRVAESTGGGKAHNILQPYQVVAFWKRVA